MKKTLNLTRISVWERNILIVGGAVSYKGRYVGGVISWRRHDRKSGKSIEHYSTEHFSGIFPGKLILFLQNIEIKLFS